MARHRLMHPATGFSLPFLLAGEALRVILPNVSSILTELPLQSGKPRRTNKCNHSQHGRGFLALQGQSVCRIRDGPQSDRIDITASISSSVFKLPTL